MFQNTKPSRNLAKMLLAVVLLTLTSCNTKTVFFWNWKDIIGLFFLAIVIFVIALLFFIDWCDNKIKLWKRKRSKK